MQRGEVLPRDALCSRVTFSNTWGAPVFVVNAVVALALCFSMSRDRPFHVFKLCFSDLAKTRPKPFKINTFERCRTFWVFFDFLGGISGMGDN